MFVSNQTFSFVDMAMSLSFKGSRITDDKLEHVKVEPFRVSRLPLQSTSFERALILVFGSAGQYSYLKRHKLNLQKLGGRKMFQLSIQVPSLILYLRYAKYIYVCPSH